MIGWMKRHLHLMIVLGWMFIVGLWIDARFERIHKRLNELEKIIERIEIRLDHLCEFKYKERK